MDPNEALKVIRRIVNACNDPDGRVFGALTPREWLEELAEHVDGLDEWLSKGGFLPSDWAAKR